MCIREVKYIFHDGTPVSPGPLYIIYKRKESRQHIASEFNFVICCTQKGYVVDNTVLPLEQVIIVSCSPIISRFPKFQVGFSVRENRRASSSVVTCNACSVFCLRRMAIGLVHWRQWCGYQGCSQKSQYFPGFRQSCCRVFQLDMILR